MRAKSPALVANAILLKPSVELVIHVPERFAGALAGSLSTNLGRLLGMEVAHGSQRILAPCPFSVMLD